MMGWGAGYVTDIAYMPGYYRHQSPHHLSVACLLGGVAPPQPGPRLSYLELGCGQGYGAMVQAASNPGWQVTAIDFNPAHIAAARGFAADAGLANIRFIEADLATLAEDRLAEQVPDADFVSLHGLWSWVAPEVRAGVVRLLAAKLLPGGVAHVTYNALPAWQGALGLQRVLLEAGRRLAGRSDRQIHASLRIVQALKEADAAHLKSSSFVASMVDQLSSLPTPYLAHEYMNASWSPCFHADVANALAGAKLEWVASAGLVENFPELALTEAQRAIHDQFEDPLMRELVKDSCLTRALRQDVFVRGARRLDTAARDAALRDVVLALARPAKAFIYEATVPAGEARLEPDFYRPVVEALGEGPRRVGDLLDLREVAGRHNNPAELVGMMVGTDQAFVVSPDAGDKVVSPDAGDKVVSPDAGEVSDARPGETVMRFNELAARHLVRSENMAMSVALASEHLGTGLPCQIMELYVGAHLQRPGARADPQAWADDLSEERDAEERAKLRDFLTRLVEERESHWRALRIL